MSQYATVAEFAVYGLPVAATSDLADEDIESLIEAASATVDGVLKGRGYTQVLASWDKDLTSAVCKIAAYDLIFHTRGANPADAAHAAIVMSRDWALGHIEKVAKGLVNLAGVARNPVGLGRAFAPINLSGTEESDRGWHG